MPIYHTSIPNEHQPALMKPRKGLAVGAFPEGQDLRRLVADFEDRGMEPLKAPE